MTKTESIYKRTVVVTRTILGYELNAKQNVIANFLIPSVFGCLLYILQFAGDIVTVYRHLVEENPIWASLTLLFVYLPAIGSLIRVTTLWELWPEEEGCGWKNIKWCIYKIIEHLLIPIWSMWRYAEKIFWSIDALLADGDEKREEALENSTAPRTIEFYFFLQAFLQGLPQILLQVHILLHKAPSLDLQTIQAQVVSITANLIKLSIVTTHYQRFKSQKLGGKNYPWYKPYKYEYRSITDAVDTAIINRTISVSSRKPIKAGIVYATRENATRLKKELESRSNTPLPRMGRRPSSDLYLLPHGIVEEQRQDDGVVITRETSVVDGPPRRVFFETDIDSELQLPRRLREIKGLPEDDIAGKVVAFFWWFCFLIARILSICSFAYFYPRDIIWLLSLHFVVVVAFLLYDVKTYLVRHTRALFYVFIGLVYLFCIIEFMKKFKKTKFIYYGFFTLVFTENLVMCMIWKFSSYMDEDGFTNDWWYNYTFYTVVGCTFLSLSSMIFYTVINKPKEVVVDEEVVENST